MSHTVRITSVATEQAWAICAWIAQQGSPRNAERWHERLMAAIRSLQTMPLRCPKAEEARLHAAEDVRQRLFGVYRILLIVRGETVFVVGVHHGMRQPLAAEDLAKLLEGLDGGPALT